MCVCKRVCVCVCLKLEGFIYLFHFLFFSAFCTENKKKTLWTWSNYPKQHSDLPHSESLLYLFSWSFFPSFLFLINTYKTILLEVAIQPKYLWKAYLPWVPIFPCFSVHFFTAFFGSILFSPSYNNFCISRKTLSWRLWSASFVMQLKGMWSLSIR